MKRVHFKSKKYTRAKYRKRINFDEFNIICLRIITKILLIILLLIIYFGYIIRKKKSKKLNKPMDVKNATNIDVSQLPLSEHYKILLPKYKYHPLKDIKPEERFNLFKLEDSIDYQKMKETGKDKYIYNVCTITKVKKENLYVRDFVEYYIKFGVDKFYFGDDNPENIENLSDVLDDYIKKGIADIEYVYKRNLTHEEFFEYSFRSLKFRCKWFMFIDVDEYLELKSMTLNEYLNMPVFNKCDVIKIHWMLFDDNGLVYYDNRSFLERMNHSVYDSFYVKIHKSIVRGKDYKNIVFDATMHQPNLTTVPEQCDALGNIEKLKVGYLGVPKYQYGYFRHYIFRTAEEFAVKMLRGRHRGVKFNQEELVNVFFRVNKFTEEKLRVIEHILNRTFPKYHKSPL